MKLQLTFAFLLGAAALVAAPDAKSGQALFLRSCKTCHGAAGEGNAAVAKVMKATIPDLGTKEVQAQTDDQIKKTIAEGKGKMKPVATVSAKKAGDIVAFVRTLAKK